jgi:hypothetical protein
LGLTFAEVLTRPDLSSAEQLLLAEDDMALAHELLHLQRNAHRHPRDRWEPSTPREEVTPAIVGLAETERSLLGLRERLLAG